jgi:hypothetical protein
MLPMPPHLVVSSSQHWVVQELADASELHVKAAADPVGAGLSFLPAGHCPETPPANPRSTASSIFFAMVCILVLRTTRLLLRAWILGQCSQIVLAS